MNKLAISLCWLSATALFALLLWSCSTPSGSPSATTDTPQPMPSQPTMTGAQALPRAIVYRTKADYSRHVAVTMDESRTRIVAYPDPLDLRGTDTTPIALSGGYLLDRRGVSRRTAYLSYTIDEYATLKAAPPIDTLLARIIDRQPMAEIHTLPITAREASSNPQLCEQYIANGFEGCDNSTPTHPTTLNEKQ